MASLTHSLQNQTLSSLLIAILLFVFTIPKSTSLEINYSEITPQDTELQISGNATRLSSGIELTKINHTDNMGQVRYNSQMQLWDDTEGTTFIADFITEFSFMAFAEKRPPGDGIAFFLAEPSYEIPESTDGSGIGLLSTQEFESARLPLVAVEFDTFHNYPGIDPENVDRHVGINVKSMRSRAYASWSCNITSRVVYNATIGYNSKTKNLSVVYTGYEDNVPIQQSLFYEIDLASNLPRWVSVGFSSANGLFTSRHVLLSWSFRSTLQMGSNNGAQGPSSTNPTEEIKSKSSKTGLIAGLSAGSFVIVIVLGFTAMVLFKRRKKEDDSESVLELSMDIDFKTSTGAKRFAYEELVEATNNFSDEVKLGQGGFGGVYKGFLKSSNSYVAIKKVSSVSTQGVKEYAAEVKIISQLRHRNLVQLIGWCHRRKDLLLIYEFMPNGSLDAHIFKGKTLLPWEVRYNIARGLASALLYLHEECEHCVLHRDIKPSNVVLDSQFIAKLADFGLARLVDHEKGSQTTAVAGTLGYMAPESLMSGRASRESDVYSFGVVALEIACGRKAIEHFADEGQNGLVDWVWYLYGNENILEAADSKLSGDFDEDRMERLMIVGLWCAHPDWTSRPSMKQAIQVLDFEAPLPNLPRDMPVPTYLPRSVRPSKGSETQSSSNYTSSSQSITSSGSASTALLSIHRIENPE